MEIDDAPHHPCVTQLPDYQGNKPATQITVLKAKHKRMGAIQEAQIRTDFMEEVTSSQDGQASLTLTNDNNDQRLLVLIHLPMRLGTILIPILKMRIPRHREAK